MSVEDIAIVPAYVNYYVVNKLNCKADKSAPPLYRPLGQGVIMARIEDKTQEVIPYLQGRLIGFRVERGLTTLPILRSNLKPMAYWYLKLA